MHGQRGRFGTYKGAEVSFWYRIFQRDHFGTYIHVPVFCPSLIRAQSYSVWRTEGKSMY